MVQKGYFLEGEARAAGAKTVPEPNTFFCRWLVHAFASGPG
jgi:hypothetical protein